MFNCRLRLIASGQKDPVGLLRIHFVKTNFEIILFKYFFNTIKKMSSTKYYKCKNKTWCWSCDMCQSKPFQCFVCDKIITYRERHDHMGVHFKYTNQYLVCGNCKVNKHIS